VSRGPAVLNHNWNSGNVCLNLAHGTVCLPRFSCAAAGKDVDGLPCDSWERSKNPAFRVRESPGTVDASRRPRRLMWTAAQGVTHETSCPPGCRGGAALDRMPYQGLGCGVDGIGRFEDAFRPRHSTNRSGRALGLARGPPFILHVHALKARRQISGRSPLGRRSPVSTATDFRGSSGRGDLKPATGERLLPFHPCLAGTWLA